MTKFEDYVISFWDYVLDKASNTFDFEIFFNDFNSILKEKLALHGMLDLEDYIHYVSKYYDLNILKQFVYTSKHTDIEFSLIDIEKQIFESRYKHFKEIFIRDETFKHLLNLYFDLNNRIHIDKSKKILLMDRCIHAEHGHGNIMNINIEKLRRDYENKILDLSFDKSFGILTRGALEETISHLKYPFNAIFIDFDSIHALNNKIGYEKVNTIFRNMFSTFEDKIPIIGRWFSGDEILMITNNPSKTIIQFESHVKEYDLGLKYKLIYDCRSVIDLKNSIQTLKT